MVKQQFVNLILLLMVSIMTSSCGQEQTPIDTAGRDIITISKDRTISFNGKVFEIKGRTIDKAGLTKVFGAPSRVIENSFFWDNKGIGLGLKEGIVDFVNIFLLTHDERSPSKFKPIYTSPEFSYKGIIKIEDGYISNTTTIDEFRKSKIGKKEFGERTGYLGERYSPKTEFIKERPKVFIVIDAEGEGGRITGVSIY